VRCQRCDRPVCPECQRPAAVGVQCVDCVREQARTAPRTKTTFGGRQWGGRPVVTWTIIGLCVVLNVLQHVPGLGVTEALMLVPAWTAAEPWRLITSAFLHDPTWPFHILLNMYALYLIGPYLEELFGRVYYVVVYLLTALGGSAGYILLAGGYGRSSAGVYLTSALGASGAVFGLFGALFIVQRRLGRQMGQIAVIIAINLVLGFVVSGIAWQAHVGGLVVGVACAAVLAYAPRERRRLVQVVGLTAIAVIVIAATVIGLGNVQPAIHI
jgi:membrane associated rhomboid family serine protease